MTMVYRNRIRFFYNGIYIRREYKKFKGNMRDIIEWRLVMCKKKESTTSLQSNTLKYEYQLVVPHGFNVNGNIEKMSMFDGHFLKESYKLEN